MDKCKKCGNDTFLINEGITHEGSIDPETGTLNCYKIKSNEVEDIVCKKCGAEYQSPDFKEIEWNN